MGELARNMSKVFLALLVLCAASALGSVQQRPRIYFRAGGQDLGIFYVGNHSLHLGGHVEEQPVDYEVLSGEGSNHEMMLDHAFEIRSADFQFRAKVAVFENHADDADKTAHPYVIYFKNLMIEDDAAGVQKQMELKHSDSGFIWIEAGHHTIQMTGAHHPFEIRTGEDKKLQFLVQLGDNEKDL